MQTFRHQHELVAFPGSPDAGGVDKLPYVDKKCTITAYFGRHSRFRHVLVWLYSTVLLARKPFLVTLHFTRIELNSPIRQGGIVHCEATITEIYAFRSYL